MGYSWGYSDLELTSRNESVATLAVQPVVQFH